MTPQEIADIEQMQNDLALEGGWMVAHDGLSQPMIVAPNGRIFAVQELIKGKWQHAPDSEMLVTLWARALAARGQELAPRRTD